MDGWIDKATWQSWLYWLIVEPVVYRVFLSKIA